MNNLNEYRKRFQTLMESTIGDVKPLLYESATGCGSGELPPEEGKNITITYGSDGDELTLNGERIWCRKLVTDKTMTNDTNLENGFYEAWGNISGAAIVKDGTFTGFSIKPSYDLTDFPGMTRCGGEKIQVVPIFIEDSVWFIDSEYPSRRKELSTDIDRQTFYKY